MEIIYHDSENNMIEIVYILTNEAMPGYVKIGKTSTSLEQRIQELSKHTGIPLPFTCFYACTVKDMTFVERQLHSAFDNYRVNPKREFFQIEPKRIVAVLKLVEIEEITPKEDIVETREDQEALNEARERRGRFNFQKAKIPLNAEIIFIRDENIKAKVVDTWSPNSIEYNGEKTSLSRAAQLILGYKYKVPGTDYWTYEGETLDERRRRLEGEE